MSLAEAIAESSADETNRDTLLKRAQALAPVLANRSARCEGLRRCPDETVDDYVNSGLLRICQPRRYGGYELGYDVLCEATETLAGGCGSQAWVHMVLADNPLKLSAFSLEAQDEVWGKDTAAKIGVAIAPVGKARRVEGGVRWTGQHGFSSGIDHADWVICGGNIYEDGKPSRGCFALIPTREVKIIDDWFAMGLAGSGSKSFEVDDVFVPDHRVLDKKAYDEGRSPGTLHYTAPVTKLPRGGVSAVSYTAVAVGVAAGFVDNYYKFTGPRKSRGNSVSDDVGIQIGAGIASAELEAAQRMYRGAVRETMQVLERGEEVTPHMQVQGKRNAAYAAQLAMSAVQRLFNAAGGRALYADNVLQRQFRDCYAASAHHSIVWDGAAADYGRYMLRLHGS
jgi:3-hydroxy-9,10-secoandrosta-1,3,5(10)-triene-9,17-dione monooxygenase